ncbi:MAG: magnesium and cobalt transport protein CorA [Planctomycetaceae bacterium]|nr:magnesium and cobalt transport protein CorA [Planctomycetaceae bacterium]
MISVHHWDANSKTCNSGHHDRLPETVADIASDDVWWIDLSAPTPEEEDFIFGKFFPVHSLTREDITRQRVTEDHGTHLPKVEEFPDYLFVIVNPLPPGLGKVLKTTPTELPLPDAAEARARRTRRPQLSAVINHRVLVTHHYDPLECVTTATSFLHRHANAAERGPDFLFHHILDAMVDEYSPVVEQIAGRLDSLETKIFRDPSPRLLARLLRIKRIVTGLRKTLILEREVLARLIRGEFALVDEREVVYYRNVYDHLVRYTELIEAAREMVSDLMETHLSAVSTRLNQVMKVLTLISTIGMVCAVIAGIYGMNFEHMPELKWEYGYPMAISMMATASIGVIGLARWKKWI